MSPQEQPQPQGAVDATSDAVAEKFNIVQKAIPQVTRKRFLILLLFCLYSMINAFQWIEYAIITNIIVKYYGVSEIAVNWTSVIYMAIYIPGIVPATWVLNKKGLRFCVIIGSLGTMVGAWVKCGSIAPDRFWVTMIGQSIVATSQLFILNLPPRIAAVWFPTNEASRATSLGVFGNQVGIAIGFVLPPQIVTSSDPATVAHGLSLMFYGVAAFCTLIFIAIVFVFEDAPKHAPSVAAISAAERKEESYGVILKSLVCNKNYMLILITYGLNVGVFYAVSTVLNQMVTSRFVDSEKAAGYMGLIITLAGVLGSVVCGFLLDKTHLYREITLAVYFFSLVGMLAFTGALRLGTLWPLYFVSFALGFFMTGYLPIGFEFAAEVSYPNPEGTSAGLLNAAAQVFGLAFTFGSTAILDKVNVYKEVSSNHPHAGNNGDLVANCMMSVALIVGTLLTYLTSSDLRRQRAASNDSNEITGDGSSVKPNSDQVYKV